MRPFALLKKPQTLPALATSNFTAISPPGFLGLWLAVGILPAAVLIFQMIHDRPASSI